MNKELEDIINSVVSGDCRVILTQLPDNSIDMGVTSPPYNKGENKKGWLVKNVKYNGVSDKLPEDEYQRQQVEVLNELYRIIKPGGSFFYNHKIRWEKGIMLHPMDWLRKTKWNIRQEIIWDRMIAANIRGWRFWQVDERIYWLYKPKHDNDLIGDELEAKHALLTSIWRFSPERNNEHPAPFPLALPIRCIYSIMNDKKGIVIDPYCGSGTTLLAAKLLGHQYIGIEISDEYRTMAIKRLENHSSEMQLFNDEFSKHIVTKTFKNRKEKGKFTGKYGKKSNNQIQSSLFDTI